MLKNQGGGDNADTNDLLTLLMRRLTREISMIKLGKLRHQFMSYDTVPQLKAAPEQ